MKSILSMGNGEQVSQSRKRLRNNRNKVEEAHTMMRKYWEIKPKLCKKERLIEVSMIKLVDYIQHAKDIYQDFKNGTDGSA
jgi:hypothetical protein